MKYSIFAVLLLIFISCKDKRELEFKAEIQDVYAFELDNGWEVNINTKIEGFETENVKDDYEFDIKYNIDLITPDGNVEEAVYQDKFKQTSFEKLNDYIIESQIELDSTYEEGPYKILFTIEDLNSNTYTKAEKEFNIGG